MFYYIINLEYLFTVKPVIHTHSIMRVSCIFYIPSYTYVVNIHLCLCDGLQGDFLFDKDLHKMILI